MMKDNREFGGIVDLVRSGRDVEDGKLLDAWNYAADGVNEMYRLCKSLLEGFREQARVMRKMAALIDEKDRQLSEKNLLIWKLNRKLQGAGQVEDRGAPHPSAARTPEPEDASCWSIAPATAMKSTTGPGLLCPEGEGFAGDEDEGQRPADEK